MNIVFLIYFEFLKKGSILIDAVFVSAEQRNKSAEFVQNNYGK